MNISMTQRHAERKARLRDPGDVATDFADVDEKRGTAANTPQPPATCNHVWVLTSNTKTSCGKCRTKAVWDSNKLTFVVTGE
jgi:hypothetical protein